MITTSLAHPVRSIEMMVVRGGAGTSVFVRATMTKDRYLAYADFDISAHGALAVVKGGVA